MQRLISFASSLWGSLATPQHVEAPQHSTLTHTQQLMGLTYIPEIKTQSPIAIYDDNFLDGHGLHVELNVHLVYPHCKTHRIAAVNDNYRLTNLESAFETKAKIINFSFIGEDYYLPDLLYLLSLHPETVIVVAIKNINLRRERLNLHHLSADLFHKFRNNFVFVGASNPEYEIESYSLEPHKVKGLDGILDRTIVAPGWIDINGERKNGTSFAAPKVCASLSLLLSCFPHLSPRQAAALLLRTAEKRDLLTYGQGVVNLGAAIQNMNIHLFPHLKSGIIIGDDIKTACITHLLKNYSEKAEHGEIDFQIMLGHIYYEGDLVPADYTKAATYWQLAANKKNKKAEYNLGYMYFMGLGVKRNYTKAYDLFRRSAQQHNPDAIDALELMKEQRLGLPRQKRATPLITRDRLPKRQCRK